MRKGHGKLSRVELRFEDGTMIALEGDAAEEWREQIDGAVGMAFVHGSTFPALPWVVTTFAAGNDGAGQTGSVDK